MTYNFLNANNKIFADGGDSNRIKINHNTSDVAEFGDSVINFNYPLNSTSNLVTDTGIVIGTTTGRIDANGGELFHIHRAGAGGANLIFTNEDTTPATMRGVRFGMTNTENCELILYEATSDFIISPNNVERWRFNAGYLNGVSGTEYRIGNTAVLTATTLGSGVVNSSLTSVGTLGSLNVTNNINTTSGVYRVGGVDVLSGTTLGSGVVNSSLTSVGTLGSLAVTNNINTTSGVYQVGGSEVLSGTTLGSGVVNSSLTSVGTLTSLTVSGDLTVDSTTFVLDSTLNRIGIGTNDPDTFLEIQESLAGQSNPLKLSNPDSAGDVTLDFSTGALGAITGRIINESVGAGNRDLVFEAFNGTGVALVEGIRIRGDTNNIGIGGVTNPLYKLTVDGDVNITTGNVYRINGTEVLSASTLGSGVTASSLTSVGTLSSLTMGGNIDLGTNNITNATSITATNLTGTLQTASQTNVTSVGTLTSLTVSGDLTVDTNTLYVDSSNDRVGIGLTNPDTKLEIQESLAGTASPLKLSNPDSAGDIAMDFSTGLAGAVTARIINDSVGGGDRDLVFEAFNGSGGGLTEGIRIRGNTNNIGIGGVTNPLYKLTVDGDTNVTSGNVYRINGTSVLSASTLGSGVTASSLTSVGTLTSLSVTGTSTLTGGFNTGTSAIGGHTIMLNAEKSSAASATTYYSFGNGGNNVLIGMVMPKAGKIIMAGIRAGSSSTATVTIYVRNAANTIQGTPVTISLSAAQNATNDTYSYAFAAGEHINAAITSGTMNSNSSVTIVCQFD